MTRRPMAAIALAALGGAALFLLGAAPAPGVVRRVADEAVDRLPEPLHGLWTEAGRRARLQDAASAAPDEPLDPAEAPHEAARAAVALGEAMKEGRAADALAQAAEAVRAIVVLHRPTAAAETVEADALAHDRRACRFLAEPEKALDAWAAEASERPEEAPSAGVLRGAAARAADLLYTAWVRAGKPVTLVPPPEAPAQPVLPYLLVGVVLGLGLIAFWPRRRRAGTPGSKG